MDLETVLTSSVFTTLVGIIVGLIANNQLKKVENKLSGENKKLEINLNALKGRQKYEYELIVNSLKEIWTEMTQLENYFILIMSGDGFVYDPQFKPVRESVHRIRNKMLFLPEGIHTAIQNFLESLFEEYIQEYHSSSQEIVARNNLLGKKISIEEHPNIIKELSGILGNLQSQFFIAKDELRKEIRNGLVNFLNQNE